MDNCRTEQEVYKMSKKYKSAKTYPNMDKHTSFGFYRNGADMFRRTFQWSMLNNLIQSKADLDMINKLVISALGSLRQEYYKFKDSIA